MLEVRRRRDANPKKPYWTHALELGRELEAAGDLDIRPESFARRIADKLKTADGTFPKTPYRAQYAFSRMRSAFLQALYWLDQYEQATGRSREAIQGLPPWTGDPMKLLTYLASLLESED